MRLDPYYRSAHIPGICKGTAQREPKALQYLSLSPPPTVNSEDFGYKVSCSQLDFAFLNFLSKPYFTITKLITIIYAAYVN